MKSILKAFCVVALLGSSVAWGQETKKQLDGDLAFIQSSLAMAKFAGMCGVMQQMIAFQTPTKIEGGDKFISRFWQTEFARLGISQEKFFEICEKSINHYDKLINAAEEAKEAVKKK